MGSVVSINSFRLCQDRSQVNATEVGGSIFSSMAPPLSVGRKSKSGSLDRK